MAHSRLQHQLRNGCPRPRHPHTATGTGQKTTVSASRQIVLVERSRHIKVPAPHQRALNLGPAASPGAQALFDSKTVFLVDPGDDTETTAFPVFYTRKKKKTLLYFIAKPTRRTPAARDQPSYRTPKADSSDRMESTLARRATLCFFRHEGDTVGQVQQEHALRARLQ